MSSFAGRTAASLSMANCLLWAVPVQAGKVCNHRASPNRPLSSIPRNGYGAANMQCAGRATAHREPLVDGKIRRPVNVCFREAAARHEMVGQSPERAVHVGQALVNLLGHAAVRKAAVSPN